MTRRDSRHRSSQRVALCVGDNESATEPCSVLSEALDGPTAIAVSGDSSVYATAIDSDSVAGFSRDTLP